MIPTIDPGDHAQAQVIRQPAFGRLLLIHLVTRHSSKSYPPGAEFPVKKARMSNPRRATKTSQAIKSGAPKLRNQSRMPKNRMAMGLGVMSITQ